MSKVSEMVSDLNTEIEQESSVSEVVEQTKEENPKPADKPVEAEPMKNISTSYLSEKKDDDSYQHGNLVPVSALQKERQKRQELQRRIAELEKQPEPEPEIDLDLTELVNNPDEFIDNKTAAKLIQHAAKTAVKGALSHIGKQREEEQFTREHNMRQEAIANSENQARSKFPDFDNVVKTAIENGGFTAEEVASIRNSSNPGAILYRKAKEAISTLGVEVPKASSVQQQTENKQPDVESDEDIYSSVFGKKTG
jgi:hypothetical protein